MMARIQTAMLTFGFAAVLGGAAQALDVGQRFSDCAHCPEMVVVPAGAFRMGSTPEERMRDGVLELFGNREQPVRTVTLARPFAISRTEVTRAQYTRFADATGRPAPVDCQTFDREKDNWVGGPNPSSWRDPGFPQTDTHPVACTTWTDATDYAAWLSRTTGHSYRVPTEAEWEYAARGGTTGTRYWSDDVRQICKHVNIMSAGTQAALGYPKSWADRLICSSGRAWTVPVASYPANPFGLHDMVGSLWEWTADCAQEDYVGAPVDGSARRTPECQQHHMRGGAFHSQVWLARVTTRGKGMDKTFRPLAAGIRVVRDLD